MAFGEGYPREFHKRVNMLITHFTKCNHLNEETERIATSPSD